MDHYDEKLLNLIRECEDELAALTVAIQALTSFSEQITRPEQLGKPSLDVLPARY